MKKIMLLLTIMPLLSSCGAIGSLLGSVARLPVDIVKAGTGMHNEGDAPPEDLLESDAPYHTLGQSQ